MLSRRTLLAAALLCLAQGFRAAPHAADPPGPAAHVGLVGTFERVTEGNDSYGYCDAAVVFRDQVPLVGFGVDKRPGEREKYLYILLFKSGPGPLEGQGVEATVNSSGDSTDEKLRITLGTKVIDVAYKYEADLRTHAFKSQSLKVGDVEVKRGGPRVFLIDLTQKTVSCRPVEVALPDEVPALKDKDQDKWPETMVRAVDQLRKKSPEVKEFLGR
jgi:hypothetical protein